MTRDQIIKRTISKWAGGIGIVSLVSQEKLSRMIIAALDEAAQQTDDKVLCRWCDKPMSEHLPTTRHKFLASRIP